jgi:hypothetical protein
MPFASQHVSIGAREIQGFLDCPDEPRALVLFVHEHGCGRHDPEDNQIATTLHKSGFATLLVDLFDPKERYELSVSAREAELSARIADVIDWLLAVPPLKGLALHCVGSGDIADPLLRAACTPGHSVGRIVLWAPRREPDANLLRRAPPTLILGNDGPGLPDKRDVQTVGKPNRGLPVGSAGKARIETAGHRIAEWIGRDDEGSPASNPMQAQPLLHSQ